MRRPVAHVGSGASGHIILPGSLSLALNPVPVFFANDFTKRIGKAGDLVEERQFYTMDIQLDDEWRFKVHLRDWLMLPSFADLDAEPVKPNSSRLKIRGGLIRSIGIAVTGANPGMAKI